MKQLIALILSLGLLLGLTACGGDTASSEQGSTDVLTDSSVDNASDTASSNDGPVEEIDPDTIVTNTAFPENYVEPEPVEYNNGGTTYVMQYANNISVYKYCGHWQADESDPHTFVSHWNTAYVEIDFTGDTVCANFTYPSNIRVSVDGGDFVKYDNAVGVMTFKAKGNGKHTLHIRNDGNLLNHVYFAGASVPKGQTLSRTADKPHYIQFIGDSISQDGRSHAHNSANLLGWDYSVCAKGGMSLQSGYGYWGSGNPVMLSKLGKSVGMEDAFFKLGHPVDDMTETDKQRYSNYFNDDTLNFNFHTGNTPDVVFVFLGTNDGLTKESRREDFVAHYTAFIDKILKVYGNKPHIYIMQALSATYEERYISIDTAGKQIAAKHPTKVTFIDRETVDSWGVEIGTDGTHPSEAGYATLSQAVAVYLSNNVE